jgi:hypothetical protein
MTVSPLPASPARGEVPTSVLGTIEAKLPASTSPSMGEAGRGWGHKDACLAEGGLS